MINVEEYLKNARCNCDQSVGFTCNDCTTEQELLELRKENESLKKELALARLGFRSATENELILSNKVQRYEEALESNKETFEAINVTETMAAELELIGIKTISKVALNRIRATLNKTDEKIF